MFEEFLDGEARICKIGDKEVLEMYDEIDDEWRCYEVIASLDPCLHPEDEFFKLAISIMMEVGAKVTGIDDPDDIWEIEPDEEDPELLWWMYQEAEASLPEDYMIENPNPDCWLLLKLFDELIVDEDENE